MIKTKTDWLDETAATASANSTWFTVDNANELLVFVRVTDIPVTGTFDLKIQTKDPDGNAVDLTSAAITQVTDTTINTYLAVIVFGSQVRVAVTIGSGTYTYKVHATAKGQR